MSGKKQQTFQGKECFSRMNFLYQASMLMAGSNNTLAAYYGELCKNIGKKAVLKMDPDVKRQLCKRCSIALRPGITADLSADSKQNRRKRTKNNVNIDENACLQLSCRQCGCKRRYVVNPEYKFWLENKESVVEAITVRNENNDHKLDEATNSKKQKGTVKKETNQTAHKDCTLGSVI